MSFFFECYGDHRDLHVLTHSFPTRRSSELLSMSVNPVTTSLTTFAPAWRSPANVGAAGSCSTGMLRLPPTFQVRSEEHTSELQSLMRISYAVFCLQQKQKEMHEQLSEIKPA